jgi:diguanylate cyclase (GGDEF)-like protein
MLSTETLSMFWKTSSEFNNSGDDAAFLKSQRDQLRLRALEKVDTRLRRISLLVILILTFAVVSLVIRVLSFESNMPLRTDLDRAGKALVAIILLFNLHTVYQQFLLVRLRRKLMEQRVLAGEFEALTLIDRRLCEEIARSKRMDHFLTVLCIDLDDFKKINDVHGHSAGDLALKEFARILQKSIRNSDVPIRVGGDEFMVLLPECLPNQVQSILARLNSITVKVEDKSIPVQVSAGSVVHNVGESAEELRDRADQELYRNKLSRKPATK